MTRLLLFGTNTVRRSCCHYYSSKPIFRYHPKAFFSATSFTAASASSPSTNPDLLSFPSKTDPSPYDIFHLSPNCTQKEIKHRYLELVRLYHPDTTRLEDSKLAADRFKAIKDAHHILSSPYQKALLDRKYYYTQSQSQYLYTDPYLHMKRDLRYANVSHTKMAHERPKYQSTSYDFANDPTFRTVFYTNNNTKHTTLGDLSPLTRKLIFIGLIGFFGAFYVWQLSHLFNTIAPSHRLARQKAAESSASPTTLSSPYDISTSIDEARLRRHYEAQKALDEARREAFIWAPDHRHKDKLQQPPGERPSTGHGI